MVIRFTQRIHTGKLSNSGVILTRTIVVQVQALQAVKFLAVVFVSLQSLLRALVMGHTILIIMRGLLDCACIGCYDTVVPLMILEIETVGIGGALRLDIPIPPFITIFCQHFSTSLFYNSLLSH